MKRMVFLLLILISTAELYTDQLSSDSHLQIRIEEGEHFLHRIPIFLFIAVKVPPQMALWLEDLEGNFIQTLFVTRRTALGNWRKAPGDDTPKEEIRRPESLPCWTHRSTGMEAMKPEAPITDVDDVSSATPKSGFSIPVQLPAGLTRFRVLAEVNASLDFNEAYPKDAAQGSREYSGGPWGSGQPALVYAAEVDTSKPGAGPVELKLAGHSSPNGSTGDIYRDMEGITTARDIIEKIEIELR